MTHTTPPSNGDCGLALAPDDYDISEVSTAYRKRFEGQIQRRGSTTDAERKERMQNAAKVADEYYNFVSPYYERGWGQTFHYCPLTKGLSIDDSMKVYDEQFAKRAGLKRGMKVLDVGCGIGGPARTIARAVGCHITGITINKWHVERGNALTREAGLKDQVVIMQSDFLKMPFENESFDAVYAFDALCYAPDVRDVYREIWRVLKPGGPFGNHDWVMTDKYDESNRKHRHIRNQIELGNGITNMPLLQDVYSGLKEVGFVLQEDENMALRSKPRPWYYGPAGYWWWSVGWNDFKKVFMMSTPVVKLYNMMFRVMIPLDMVDPEVLEAADTMWACCRSVAAGGATGIFSPMWQFICRKPSPFESGATEYSQRSDVA